MANVQMFTSPW